MTIQEVLQKSQLFLKQKNISTPRLDSEILLAHALKLKNRVDLYVKFDRPLSEAEIEQCRDLIKRRGQGEPVAYLTGEKEFAGFSFVVSSAVLIPRPETEIIIEEVERWANHHQTSLSILDLGTGSGCLGLTLAKKFPGQSVTLVDISKDALEIANLNRSRLELGETQVSLICSDARSFTCDQKFNVIVANPPYLKKSDPQVEAAVARFEPSTALYAEQDGLAEINAWSLRAKTMMDGPGIMIFEIGFEQGLAAKKAFEELEIFSRVEIKKDLAGLDRFVIGEIDG